MANISSRAEKSLSYTIHRVSSYSANYPPKGVLEDNPNEWTSRWSSDSFVAPQYLILKLIKPSIVTEIRFGKYKKQHLCNVKRFKVFGGLSEESMIEILDEGLNNDGLTERFRMRHEIRGKEFPCRYVKIEPIQTWNRSVNFSIWFIEFRGYDDCALVKERINWLNEYRQKEAIRLCLKHLRQKNYCEAFESLQKRTRVQLEAQILTKLHKLLVIDGDYESSERLLDEVCDNSLFDSYIRKQDYRPVWKRLAPKNPRPGMRGGHQMCIDSYAQKIYLFGGWDGTQDMADLWSYDIGAREWTFISGDTSLEDGPTARSCHKISIDPIRKKIYTLGRYLDQNIRSMENLKSDFYVYDIPTNKWSLISEDTAAMGGPQLVFDHQMCMDLDKNKIYIFGGRILSCSVSEDRSINCPEQPLFSGLFVYDVANGRWHKLRDDCPPAGGPLAHEIKSRIGHSMLFHQKSRLLYIFAGQRQKEYLSDFFTYDVDSDEIKVINDGDKSEVPAAGFTQRATIDPESQEIYVLSGLNNDKEKDRDKDKDACVQGKSAEETVRNSFWVYDIPEKRWSCIYRNENSLANRANDGGGDCDPTSQTTSLARDDKCSLHPCPRFAHQLVYDHMKKCHYLFGGNPGRSAYPKLRLDDFWTLELKRLTNKVLLRKCKRLVREQAFKEIIQTDGAFAIRYLQNDLHQTFNHSDPEECRAFQSLASLIFRDHCSDSGVNPDLDPDHNYTNRTKVFDTIVEYFPEEMTQPKANLVDLVLV